MNIDAFINSAVIAHNCSHPDIVVSKSYILGFAWYFLYLKDFNIWGSEEIFLYRFIYERLSQDRIYPQLLLREVDGEQKIGIAFEVKDA